MALHCPADDGVVVWRVAPIPGDFSDHFCMAHGFENMRKPRMRPQLTLPLTYRQRPHASPSQMTPSCSRTTKNMEHSILREPSKRWGHVVTGSCHRLPRSNQHGYTMSTRPPKTRLCPQTRPQAPSTLNIRAIKAAADK
jgi:hypothetical protein